MKIYKLTKENSTFLETFKTLKDLQTRIKEINKTLFNGENFIFFGPHGVPPFNKDSFYLVSEVNNKETYTLFFIHCIDSITGELCEL